MKIENDEELEYYAHQAGEMLQAIFSYTGRVKNPKSQVKFPRGVIRTADYYRNKLPDHIPNNAKSSCAYAFMYTDVLWWLSTKTDISGTGKEMILKSAIISFGTILEALLIIPNVTYFSKNSNTGTKKKLKILNERKLINKEDQKALEKLWDQRCNVHLKELEGFEHGSYTIHDVNKPQEAIWRLIETLKLKKHLLK